MELRYIINNLEFKSNAFFDSIEYMDTHWLITDSVDFKLFKKDNMVVIESLQKGESYPTTIIDSKRCMFNVIEELQDFIDTYR